MIFYSVCVCVADLGVPGKEKNFEYSKKMQLISERFNISIVSDFFDRDLDVRMTNSFKVDEIIMDFADKAGKSVIKYNSIYILRSKNAAIWRKMESVTPRGELKNKTFAPPLLKMDKNEGVVKEYSLEASGVPLSSLTRFLSEKTKQAIRTSVELSDRKVCAFVRKQTLPQIVEALGICVNGSTDLAIRQSAAQIEADMLGLSGDDLDKYCASRDLYDKIEGLLSSKDIELLKNGKFVNLSVKDLPKELSGEIKNYMSLSLGFLAKQVSRPDIDWSQFSSFEIILRSRDGKHGPSKLLGVMMKDNAGTEHHF